MLEVAERSKSAETESRIIDCFAKNTYVVPPELTIMEPGDMASSDFGCFRIMSQADGDKRVIWCRRVIAEITAAKKMFIELIGKGLVPYKVGVKGERTSEVMTEFDPTAEEVIFMPIAAIGGG